MLKGDFFNTKFADAKTLETWTIKEKILNAFEQK